MFYPVGSIYLSQQVDPNYLFPNTTWTQIADCILASEHIFGNGRVLGLTDGATLAGAFMNSNKALAGASGYIGDVLAPATTTSGSGSFTNRKIGVPTSALLSFKGESADSTGLVADVEQAEVWLRTA